MKLTLITFSYLFIISTVCAIQEPKPDIFRDAVILFSQVIHQDNLLIYMIDCNKG